MTHSIESVADHIPEPWGARIEVMLRELGGMIWIQIASAIVLLRLIIWVPFQLATTARATSTHLIQTNLQTRTGGLPLLVRSTELTSYEGVVTLKGVLDGRQQESKRQATRGKAGRKAPLNPGNQSGKTAEIVPKEEKEEDDAPLPTRS